MINVLKRSYKLMRGFDVAGEVIRIICTARTQKCHVINHYKVLLMVFKLTVKGVAEILVKDLAVWLWKAQQIFFNQGIRKGTPKFSDQMDNILV